MWSRWRALLRQNLSEARSFSFSSFRDVETVDREREKEEKDTETPAKRATSIFQRVRLIAATLRNWTRRIIQNPDSTKVVVYFTSLRVVRRTFEDCQTVRSLFCGYRIPIDERDLSMDTSFIEEFERILGKEQVTLPRIFIGGKYIGGVDEIFHLHENGELKKMLEGFPTATPGICEACGGIRFVLCGNCNGSHKEALEDGDFRSCPSCNKNGLIKCPSCC